MPHIHTLPGQNDICVNVFVVYQDRVLLRLHEKYHIWLPPGGHVELDETPEVAALREVKEEVGLEVELWRGNTASIERDMPLSEYQELVPPVYMNRHRISDDHHHIVLMYFATTSSSEIREPENHEKSGGCAWLTRQEIEVHPEIDESTKYYSIKALELLAH